MFSFAYLAVSIIYIIVIFVLIFGSAFLLSYINQRRNYLFQVKLFYWILISFLILLNLIVILSPVFLRNDDGWVLFLEFSTMIISITSTIFLAKTNPDVVSNSHNEELYAKRKNQFRYLVPIVLVLFLISTVVFWILFYRIPYGSDEGMAGFLLFTLMRFNAVSFIPICGIFYLQSKEKVAGKVGNLKSNLKTIKILTVFTLIGIFSTIAPVISIYMKETRQKFLAANILFYYIFIIGSISTLILLYFVNKNKVILEKNV